MKKNATIIGVGGVGMAHVCALVREGWEIDQMIDTNDRLIASLQGESTWSNNWGIFSEKVDAQPKTIISEELSDKGDPNIDLLIIAVPYKSQPKVLDEWYLTYGFFPKKVFLEKPPSYDSYQLLKNKGVDVYVGSQYVTSEQVQLANAALLDEDEELSMIYFKCPHVVDSDWKASFHPYENLMPHVVSVLAEIGFSVNSIDHILNRQKKSVALVNVTHRGNEHRAVELIVEYGHEHVFLIITDSYEFKVEHHPDLFDNQLRYPFSADMYFRNWNKMKFESYKHYSDEETFNLG